MEPAIAEAGRWGTDCRCGGRQGAARDSRGGTARGAPGVRLVSGYAHGSGLTVGQKGGQAGTGRIDGRPGTDGGTAAGGG